MIVALWVIHGLLAASFCLLTEATAAVAYLPIAELLVEQIDHRLPRALVGDRIVGQRRIADLAGIWVGEAVHRAAIGMQLPVHLGLPHLLFESGDLRRRNKRIVGAVTDQHLAADVLVVVRTRRLKAAMEADGGPQRCTAPGQFKRRAAAEAIADRRKLPAIHPRLRPPRVDGPLGTPP